MGKDSDDYIKSLLCKQGVGLVRADIPDELVEIKRIHLEQRRAAQDNAWPPQDDTLTFSSQIIRAYCMEITNAKLAGRSVSIDWDAELAKWREFR